MEPGLGLGAIWGLCGRCS